MLVKKIKKNSSVLNDPKTCVSKKIYILNLKKYSVLNYPKTCVSKKIEKGFQCFKLS